jgi:hypothetical protein
MGFFTVESAMHEDPALPLAAIANLVVILPCGYGRNFVWAS